MIPWSSGLAPGDGDSTSRDASWSMPLSFPGPACLSRPSSAGPVRGRSTGKHDQIRPRSHAYALARAPTRIMHRADRRVDLVRAHRNGAAAAGADPDALGAGALAMSDQAASHCNVCYYCTPALLLQSACCYCKAPVVIASCPGRNPMVFLCTHAIIITRRLQ